MSDAGGETGETTDYSKMKVNTVVNFSTLRVVARRV